MRSRGAIIAVAFVFAVAAAVAVFFYVDGVRKTSETAASPVSVIVAKQDIPAGANLDELIAQGAFSNATVPIGNLVPGAVTALDELAGETTSAAIIAGEQIPAARLVGSTASLPGGTLGIPAGHQALTVALDNPRSVGGNTKPGDRVTVYATVDAGDGARSVVVVPEARVLAIGGETGTELTLALRPRDAQSVVFGGEKGTLWFSLLPPGQKGVNTGSVGAGDIGR